MMDVDESPSPSLFDVLRSFRTKHNHHEVCQSPYFTQVSIDLNSPQPVRRPLYQMQFDELFPSQEQPSASRAQTEANTSKNNSRKAPRKHGKDGVCIQLPNTGRFVFAASTDQVSDIYRAVAQDSKAAEVHSKSNGRDQALDSDPLRKMNDLSLSAKEAKDVENSRNKGTSTDSRPKNNTQNTSKSTFTPKAATPNSSSVSIAKPPVHAGRAAAMARMAAMGEEWPEEEELPGFSRPNNNPAVNSNTGILSRDANKQLNDAMQRQKKVVIAKRKG